MYTVWIKIRSKEAIVHAIGCSRVGSQVAIYLTSSLKRNTLHLQLKFEEFWCGKIRIYLRKKRPTVNVRRVLNSSRGFERPICKTFDSIWNACDIFLRYFVQNWYGKSWLWLFLVFPVRYSSKFWCDLRTQSEEWLLTSIFSEHKWCTLCIGFGEQGVQIKITFYFFWIARKSASFVRTINEARFS